ncbi:MAG: membrane protein insertion efficiency factor YidD [Alphaproteobacteria bacterium]|nr:membrane protein insertion efficiency factor YidD [Alphaproteobacteria bacterium]
MRKIAIAAIRLYQLIAPPFIRGRCRYQPSCSTYAITAIKRFGVLKGIWLTAKRLARCAPWGGYGYDPVPGAKPENRKSG